MDPLKAGDVVKLLSGGPPMTVAAIKKDHALVFWFDAGGALRKEDLPVSLLVKASEPRQAR